MKDALQHLADEAAAGRLALMRCRRCGAGVAAPRERCPSCGAADLAFVTAVGRGRVAAVTVMHRAPTPQYRARVPYAIALVDLAPEDVRIMAHADPQTAVGDTVRVAFHEVDARHLAKIVPDGER